MTEQQQLALAFSISAQAFKDIYDKAGEPYFKHCLAVYDGVKHYDVKTQIVALLHDVVEDTDWTLVRLRRVGFEEDIILSVDLVTKPETGYNHKVYIETLAKETRARRVKIADIGHNSNITRLKGTTSKDYARLEQYHADFLYLMQKERECLFQRG